MVSRSGPAATLSGYPVDVLLDWLRSSCEAQGLPVTVRDAQVIANVAVLLGVSSPQERGAGAGARVRVRARPQLTGLGAGSEAPDGTYPGGIEPAPARRFCDDDMVQDG
jgi:hypothetical protein